MIKGIIFDLDGVLVSTDELHYIAWKKLAVELGIHNYNREDNQRQRGISRMASLEILLEKSNKVYSEKEKIFLAEQKNGFYMEELKKLDKSVLLKNIEQALMELKCRNLLLSVGSASKNALTILEKTGLLPYFNQISSGLDTTYSKPNPEVFLIAAEKMQLEPEACLVVEDAAAGIEAARRGNMRSLAVGPLYQTLEADFKAEMLCMVTDWNNILA